MITGKWNLKDIESIREPYHGKKVFSCFHCGGGSTMGYKLAGYEVLGGVEIDSKMMAIYRKNHNPKHSYFMGVQKFKTIPDFELPAELFDLDILDGSPPCSSFSMSGSREKSWSDKKKFREGQAEQVLDTLFFDFIDIAKKLQPKIVVAENVKGLIQGNAKGYVKQIFTAFKESGYECQLFLLNASRMGVPQVRERTFFIARLIDLSLPKIKLEFDEHVITVEQCWSDLDNQFAQPITNNAKVHWEKIIPGQSIAKVNNGSGFNNIKMSLKNPAHTLAANSWVVHPKEPRHLSKLECSRLQTFPDDFIFLDAKPQYICGMSVPPFMMQRLSNEIYHQLLK